MVLRTTTHLLQQWHPLVRLSLVFVLWKATLLLIVFTSPGPGYDTSTTLFEFNPVPSHPDGHDHVVPAVSKLVRWDAIYFIQMAQRGHVFEQEWAFGRGISSHLSWASRSRYTIIWMSYFLRYLAFFRTDDPTLWQIASAGVALSHFAHFGSMVLIWAITHRLDQCKELKISSTAAVAALLYILSPAGIFLSAPYTESIFAFYSFLGLGVYISGRLPLRRHVNLLDPISIMLAGAVFGQATVMRSNGILAGLLYVTDALISSFRLVRDRVAATRVLRLAAIVFGGLFVGWGLVSPQYDAYIEYCFDRLPEERREWCERPLPSIFSFVQAHYWSVMPAVPAKYLTCDRNNGLFRYWTASNIPLFVLATPTLGLMTYSALQCIPHLRQSLLGQPTISYLSHLNQTWLWRLALPQLVLALLAVTSFHVQIINRISSGYPLWYIWLAALACKGGHEGLSKGVVRWMVTYAFVQAGLYASFLPPA
jgi:GPI mannosyltransferase 2